MRHDGANEGEVDQRRDKTREAAGNPAIGMNFDIIRCSYVYFDSQKNSGFGLQLVEASLRLGEKRSTILCTDLDVNAVKFSNDVAQAECCQVPQAAPLTIQEAVIAQYPFDGSFVKLEMEVFEDLLSDGRAR